MEKNREGKNDGINSQNAEKPVMQRPQVVSRMSAEDYLQAYSRHEDQALDAGLSSWESMVANIPLYIRGERRPSSNNNEKLSNPEPNLNGNSGEVPKDTP